MTILNFNDATIVQPPGGPVINMQYLQAFAAWDFDIRDPMDIQMEDLEVLNPSIPSIKNNPLFFGQDF